MNSDEVRGSAFAELATGLIDTRERAAEERFDIELDAAVAAGRVDSETARTLRWWQRESVRAVVDHAEQVLPATLLALESAGRVQRERTAAQHQPSVMWEGSPSSPSIDDGEYRDDLDDEHEVDSDPPDEDLVHTPVVTAMGYSPTPPIDLTSRRLLVAGLTPLRDP